MMMCLSKWFSSAVAIVLLASTAAGADAVTSGKVKSINADNKTFVVTDRSEKDVTFTFGDNMLINRAGKEGKSSLKTGDAISICYDKGPLTWTANYILVQEGTAKNSELIHGTVKGYDAVKKEITLTSDKKDSTYAMGKAPVRLNMEDTTIDNVKIGDHVLIVVDTVDGKSTLHSVMIHRAK